MVLEIPVTPGVVEEKQRLRSQDWRPKARDSWLVAKERKRAEGGAMPGRTCSVNFTPDRLHIELSAVISERNRSCETALLTSV